MTAVSAVQVSSPPWVDLYISSLPATTTRVEVTRTWAGVSERVRGDSAAMVLGADTRVVDWAAPVGTGSIVYSVQAFSAAGAALSAPATVTVTASTIEFGMAWVSDPHDPTSAVLVQLLGGGPAEGASAPMSGSLVTATGLPLGLIGDRQMRARTWRMRTDSAEQFAALETALSSSGVLLRADPTAIGHRTGVVYMHAPVMSWDHQAIQQPVAEWEFSGTETRGPKAPPAIAARTYQDDLDEYPTYQASLDAQPTYLDRLRG